MTGETSTRERSPAATCTRCCSRARRRRRRSSPRVGSPASGLVRRSGCTWQLWNRRHFLWAEARAKVTSGTRENLLGTVWLVLKPVLDGLTYFLIFGLLLKSSRGIDNFIGYLIVGVFLFSFTTKAVTAGNSSERRNLIRRSFPRLLPSRDPARDARHDPGARCHGVCCLMPPAEVFTWRVVLVPGVLALQVLFTTGLALLLARCVAVVPDLNQLISFGMRLWLYGSAVFFSYDQFIDHPTALALMEANPMFMVLSMVRDCLLYGVTPALSSWLGLGAWAVGTLVVGFLFFYHGEESYGRA
nr:ABC transporter permease [Cellulosimicrobium sp. MM]